MGVLPLNSVGVIAAVKTLLGGSLGVLGDSLGLVEACSTTISSVANSNKAFHHDYPLQILNWSANLKCRCLE